MKKYRMTERDEQERIINEKGKGKQTWRKREKDGIINEKRRENRVIQKRKEQRKVMQVKNDEKIEKTTKLDVKGELQERIGW